MRKNIKIALLGCGNWGQNIARNLSDMGYLSCVYDQNKNISERFNKKYGLPNISIDEILQNKEIDGVVIASSAITHKELAAKSILNDKDVLIEKPFCLSLSDAKHLSKLSIKRKKVLMAGHLLNYHNAFIKMKKIINDNVIGDVVNIRAHRLALGSIRSCESVTYDLAAHDISMVLSITQSMPNEITVQSIHHNNNEGPDAISVKLSFANKVTALINCDWMCPYKEHKFSVIGKTGGLIFNDTEDWPYKLVYNPSYINTDNTITSIPLKNINVVPNEPLKSELEEFINCIISRQSPLTDHKEAINVQTVMEMIEEKLKTLGKS
jgi:UDP-2-acetamido-3-amino-2,3-dideoxy-glucuronate N-acetyltransferase